MPSSVAGAVGSAVASKVIGSALGGGKKSSGGGGGSTNQGILPFYAGGMQLVFNNEGVPHFAYLGQQGTDRLAYLKNQQNSFTDQAASTRAAIPGINAAYDPAIAGIQGALDTVNPGFGKITDARVNTVRNAGMAAESDLKGNLARRRVLGSSFGNDDISRTKAEFAQQEADARAKSYLEELDTTTKLIGQKLNYQTAQIDSVQSYVNQAFAFDRASDQVQLDELNLQLSTMMGLISGMQQQAQRNAEIEAKYAAEGAANRGQTIAGIASPIGDWIGGKVGGMFGSGETWANGDIFR